MVFIGFFKSRRIHEIIGIIFLMVGVLTAISLYSFNKEDPYIFATNQKIEGQIYKNYAGFIGATISRFLLDYLGYGVFFFTAIIIIFSLYELFANKKIFHVVRFLGVILLFFSFITIFSLIFKTANFKGYIIPSGGELGTLIALYQMKYLNHIGGWLLTCTICLLGFVLLTEISFPKILRSIGSMQLNLAKKIGTFIFHGSKSQTRKADSFSSDFELNQTITKSQKKSKTKRKNNKTPKTQLALFQDVPITYQPPIHKIFDPPKGYKKSDYEPENIKNADKIVNKLLDFGIEGKIVSFIRGPVVTRFEYKPAPEVKISKIISAADDLALALKTKIPPRIAHVPGKGVIGVEIPNENREEVNFLQLISSEEYINTPSPLKLALGVDISGTPFISELTKMPHLLIAGATGTGKSVCINSVLCSLLVNASPEELRLLLIDPKMLELSLYNGLPHLREAVITDYQKAAVALEWAIDEMNDRYKIIAKKNVRNIQQYNELIDDLQKKTHEKSLKADDIPKKMPYYVIIIDELADLMLAPGTNIDESITRLAQMARASGIHLVLATQRPSVDVVTGIIKANFPCRISFQVSSKVDSRTILDANGAEKLLGYGDMLFIPPGVSAIQRLHGAYVSEHEVTRFVKYLTGNITKVKGEESIFKIQEKIQQSKDSDFSNQDDLYKRAVEIVVTTRMASVSLLQRKLKVGHSRAARLVDMMEEDGIVGPFEGSKTREVLVDKNYITQKTTLLKNQNNQ